MTNDAGPRSALDALNGFITASTDADADAWLASLFGPETERILHHAVARGLGSRFHGTSAVDDVAGDARVRLLSRVRELRARGEGGAIADFNGYVATVGFNAAYVFLRQRYSARSRLKNKVRYVLSREPGVRVRDDAAGQLVCEWAGPRRVATAGSARRFADDPQGFRDAHQLPVHGRSLGAVVADVLLRLESPMDLDTLVDALATLIGVESTSPLDADGAEARDVEHVPDSARDFTVRLDDREHLLRVWTAIAQLQPRQRAALLLNLRDPSGGSALALVPLTGLASIREIATVIDIPAVALARIWPTLPLDDRQIGAHLGITRQQVINLRKTARATLARRLKTAGVW